MQKEQNALLTDGIDKINVYSKIINTLTSKKVNKISSNENNITAVNNVEEKENNKDFFPAHIYNFLNDLFIEAKLNKSQQELLFTKIEEFEKQEIEKQQYNYQVQYNHLLDLLQTNWQNKLNSNLRLVIRALQWLELDNSEISSANLLKFLQKMLNLGISLSEDQDIKSDHNIINSKQQAKKERTQLTNDPKFMKALTNKSNPKHQEALLQIENLNKIIVS
ncbi:hypothetical protein ACFX5K_02795 [Rickettsiales bacterium LUAb2]